MLKGFVPPLLALLLPAAGAAGQSSPAVTFSRDIAPIVFSQCATCHRPEGDAPFSLTTFEEVRRRAAQIAAVTRSRYMPPWKPVPGFGEFTGARRLTDAQIDLLRRWVAAGSPQGDPADLPALPERAPGWQHGQPDLVVRLPAYTLPAEGADVFRNFVVRVPGSGTRYVRGMQFRSGGRGVHHANIRIDRTPASRQLDEADPSPGYEGLILHSATYPDGHFLGWTPGQMPPLAPPDLAWQLDAGSDLVVQLHMQATGKPEPIEPVIGFYFSDRPPRKTPTILRLGRQNLDIPAGAAEYRVSDSFVLPVDAEVRAVQPHAHYRARQVNAWAALPDGTRRPLLRIDDWDFSWQDQYRVAAPFWVPSGTTLWMEYVFDNSTANPRNPDRPPQRVSWGWRSSDEMADVWIQVLTRTAGDRAELTRRAEIKMLTEDAIGGETLAAREPGHVNLRNDTALIYMRLGQPAQALRHFEAVTRVEPHSPAAWYNEGVALEALGKTSDAGLRYREAIRRDPTYSAAHNNLGSLLVKDGQLAQAQHEYERAVESDPSNADARANLGLLVLGSGDTDRALAEVREALGLDPSRLPRLTPFVWLLATHPDPGARRPDEARLMAERIVAATNRRDEGALDALAACYAALGRFGDAIATADDALSLAARAGTEEARATIAGHLERYRRGEAVTMPR
jgi:tetratricopeptide (TPR) repeat protein/mono/diheme cytochrome c family protein